MVLFFKSQPTQSLKKQVLKVQIVVLTYFKRYLDAPVMY
jgi:hypothetical protein